MRKAGFHVQQTSNELRQAIETVQPTLIVSLAHERDFWLAVKKGGWPGLLTGRLFEEGVDWRAVDPRQWAERCAGLAMPYDAWITRNEPEGIYNWVTADDARRYDEWCCRFRERILELGYEAVGPNVPAGHWHGDAVVRHLPELCKSFRYISLHEYSARAMWDQQPKRQRPVVDVPQNEGESVGWWYTLRYRQWYRAICNQWPWRSGQFSMVISEGGVAYGVMEAGHGDVGWRTDMSEDQYFDSLDWYTRELNKDDYCLGWAIFMVGAAHPKWGSFETLPLCGRLWAIPEIGAVTPPPEPEEEPVSGDIRVVDLDYQERDLQYVKDKYGVAFRRAKVAPGQKVYRLVELWEKTGHVSLITQVLDERGQPMADVDVAFYWAGAPDPPDPETPLYPHDWYRNFVHGKTGGKGDVGPGMGKGAYHGVGAGGPHAVWVRDPDIPSDICEKLGMLAGTFHDHLDQKFRLVVEGGGGGGEEPEPPAGTELVEKSRETITGVVSSMLYLCFPDVGSLIYDRATFAGILGSSLDLDTTDWERYEDIRGVDWLRSGVCADWTGDAAPRTYWIQAHTLPSVATPFGPRVGAQFDRDVKKHVLVYLGYGVSPQPPPEEPGPGEPEPEPGPGESEAARLVAEISARLDRLEEILREVDAHTEAAADLLG